MTNTWQKTVIAQHGHDCSWLARSEAGQYGWTNNIFAALALDPNEAAQTAHALKRQGQNCATEPLVIAGRRHQRVMAEAMDGGK